MGFFDELQKGMAVTADEKMKYAIKMLRKEHGEAWLVTPEGQAALRQVNEDWRKNKAEEAEKRKKEEAEKAQKAAEEEKLQKEREAAEAERQKRVAEYERKCAIISYNTAQHTNDWISQLEAVSGYMKARFAMRSFACSLSKNVAIAHYEDMNIGSKDLYKTFRLFQMADYMDFMKQLGYSSTVQYSYNSVGGLGSQGNMIFIVSVRDGSKNEEKGLEEFTDRLQTW